MTATSQPQPCSTPALGPDTISRWSQALSAQQFAPLEWEYCLHEYDEPILRHALRLGGNPHQARQLMARLGVSLKARPLMPERLRAALVQGFGSLLPDHTAAMIGSVVEFHRDWASCLWSRAVRLLKQETHLIDRNVHSATELAILEAHQLVTEDPRARRTADLAKLAKNLGTTETAARKTASHYHQRLLLNLMDEVRLTMESPCSAATLKAEFKYLLGLLFTTPQR